MFCICYIMINKLWLHYVKSLTLTCTAVAPLFSTRLSLMQIFCGIPSVTGARSSRLGRGLYHLINVFTFRRCRVLLQEVRFLLPKAIAPGSNLIRSTTAVYTLVAFLPIIKTMAVDLL